ncbi:MAG: peroxiredoxin family protein [Bacteroidales bacterium]|nr:peroxiredoxin family protein [Bacteroidales bacterium]
MKKLIPALGLILFSFGVFAQTTLDTALNFTVKDTYGDNINLFDILNDGKIVVIDFFSTA